MLRRIFDVQSLKRSYTRGLHTKNTNFLSPGCLSFLDELNSVCQDDYQNCLNIRNNNFINKNYNFREDTKDIRDKEWRVEISPEVSNNLSKRHIEITGPGNSETMVINAMNSKANGYMLDLEDSMSPSFENVIKGHDNIKKAVRKILTAEKYDNDGNLTKTYNIDNTNSPIFFVRSRGLHMTQENVLDKAIPATIFDIGVHLYNNGKYLLDNNMGPYIYMPKLETFEDSLLVNKIISKSQEMLDIPHGSTKLTCLIETYPAIYQTDEIIYGLKDHIVGLNCGRWDYLYSMIKCLDNEKIFPDRDLLTMDKPFLEAYVKQIVKSCHNRGIHAMGGMSAFIPTKDKEENNIIFKKINKDKKLEIDRGCDGAWVAHPGLIEPMQELFNEYMNNDNLIKTVKINENITKEMLTDLGNNSHIYSEQCLRNNINTWLQYVSGWLSGNGAVALNNLMEDLATSEISIHQIKQWYNNNVTILGDTNNFILNKELFEKILNEEFNKMKSNNEVPYASKYFNKSKELLKEYVYGNYHFLPEVVDSLKNKQYKSIKFEQATLSKLAGSKQFTSGVELTKHRGNFLNDFFNNVDENGECPAYKFLGTSNGVSAVNVVAGGKGNVGPYAGGWQTNAMKNRLGMSLPDTLHVSPEEAANCAMEINQHLERADQVQHIQKLDNENFEGNVNYYDIALLADMEQGWDTPEKTRISVKKAIENGINVIHIEDQGPKKRCGHLGDKELNTYDDYVVIMKSANLAAQELLGQEQSEKNWVKFVARTDAYSAKRITNSSNLYKKDNLEHKFVDWEKGTSPDGKYLYLKQGVNPDTGRTWGLDLSIERCARIVDDGLASHVWMETPDADLDVAKAFITGVNEILEKKGKKAYGLYNHSPSFDWDVKFFAEAKQLTAKLINGLDDNFIQNSLNRTDMKKEIRQILIKNGSLTKGDDMFSEDFINIILNNCIDYLSGEIAWHNKTNELVDKSIFTGFQTEIMDIKNRGFVPLENITDVIVEQRLINFGKMLSSFGFNMHLITLPEYHVTAFNMHKLASDFSVNGINAFVKNTQRPERILYENDNTYTYYKHQTATGTGIEASFNKAVGSNNVNTLEDSTEADDIKKRE